VNNRSGGNKKDRVAEVANTFEWLITAFILAFVFRAFVMEAFRIPTGSMADTLLGAHFRLRCSQCGYKYNYGLGNFRVQRDAIPQEDLRPKPSRCPSCGYLQSTGGAMRASGGDRILVLKCIYQFCQPKQWDVVVFKNPLDPSENYIKRLIGKPGERVKIIDGDIYINGRISRKPPKVQDELWMPIYNNDYQPARPTEPAFNRHTWQQPFKNIDGSGWITYDPNNPTVFRLDSPENLINTLAYDTSVGNDFHATYAYDDMGDYDLLPHCSDLMVRFWCRSEGDKGSVGAFLSKYETTYRAWVDFAGEMSIAKVLAGQETVLAREAVPIPAGDKPVLLKFANVDHKLIFEFGSQKITCDLGRKPNDAGPRKTDIVPHAGLFGAGKLWLSHVALFRDIHYTEKNPLSNSSGRATEGAPLLLAEDQFFVLGDNSPRSEDGRWWDRPGKGNFGRTFPKGIVPREYLVGKALFVYWPAGFGPFPKSRFALVPNIGQLRLIYGGSDRIE